MSCVCMSLRVTVERAVGEASVLLLLGPWLDSVVKAWTTSCVTAAPISGVVFLWSASQPHYRV